MTWKPSEADNKDKRGRTRGSFGVETTRNILRRPPLVAPSGPNGSAPAYSGPSTPFAPAVSGPQGVGLEAGSVPSILERVPGGLTWRLNPKAANVLQGLFNALATKNGGVPLSVNSVGIVMIPASGKVSQARHNWVSFRPELLQLRLAEQLGEIAHEMTHVLQWYRLGSTVEERDANLNAHARVDERLGTSLMLPVARNPDGTTTPIDILIGGDPTRLDVLDRRFTLEAPAFWVHYRYVIPRNGTFSLP